MPNRSSAFYSCSLIENAMLIQLASYDNGEKNLHFRKSTKPITQSIFEKIFYCGIKTSIENMVFKIKNSEEKLK